MTLTSKEHLIKDLKTLCATIEEIRRLRFSENEAVAVGCLVIVKAKLHYLINKHDSC